MRISSANLAIDRFTTFGDLLKYLRRCAGYTQLELSIAVGYSDTQISRLEQNERLPDLATITARFIPALHLEDQPEVAARLLELAAAMRREDAPGSGFPPYKGLHYFDENDAELFFGREALTGLLVDRLVDRSESEARFLAIVGASGSGKSSVVRAGLIPALRWRQPSANWPAFLMTPTAHPLEALAACLSRESRRRLPVNKLVDELEHSSDCLRKTMQCLTEQDDVTQALLIVDQFEELFTLSRLDAEKSAFIENLVNAAFQPDETAIIVIVLRADFYAQCARFDSLRKALAQHQEYIGPMTTEELRRAIEEPARCGNWELEPGLVDLMLHDVGAEAGHPPEPGALPLLSQALLSTWQRRRGRMMTLSGYTASGGVRGAIAETAESVFYDHLEPEQRGIARQIFLRLTELGGGDSTADSRRRASISELASRREDEVVVHAVLQTLADSRLIIIDQESAEVAHEALIREWPTLRGWLEEDREGLRLHRRLTEAALEWQAMGQDPEGLYRGVRLAQALEWARSHPEDVNQLENSFLDASQAFAERETLEREAQRLRELEAARHLAETERKHSEEQARSNRNLRQRAMYLAIALGIAGILALVTLVLGQRAVQASSLATSRELAAASVNNLQVDPERSLLLALKSIETANTLEARNALHQALPELHSLHVLPAHQGGAVDVAFSPDSARLASIGEDGTAKLWEANSGQLLATLKSENSEFSSGVAFSPDGKQLATAWNTQVIVWEVASGEKMFTLSGESVGTTIGYNLAVGQISFSPDGKRLAVANMNGVSKVWDLATQSELLSLSSGASPAKAIAFSPDGDWLATGGDEGIVKVWDSERGEEILNLTLGGIIHSLAFSPNDARLVAGSEDGGVKIWDVTSGQELISLPRMSGLYDINFLADGKVATAGQDGTVRVWDTVSGQEVLTLAGHVSTVVGVAGSPDGQKIASSGYDGSVRIWDARPGRELLTTIGHQGIVWDVVYSPDGTRLASASVDGRLKLWHAESGAEILTLSRGDNPTDGFTSLAFSPDGARLAGGSIDGVVSLWNSQSGELQAKLSGHTNMVVGLIFSPDGARLASAAWDGTAKVWDLSSGKAITTFDGHADNAMLTGIAFSPDGERIFTGGDDNFVRMWDASSGQEIRAFSDGEKDIYGVALSPDGKTLAAGFQDGAIGIFDVESGETLHSLSGHAGLILQLAFNQDGTHLASASFDRLAKIWDVATGEELLSLYGNQANVFSVSFSPDGRRLTTAGADGSLRTYLLSLDELIALAKSRLSRTLTTEECRKFLHLDTCP